MRRFQTATASAAEALPALRVVTYNLLAPELAGPNVFRSEVAPHARWTATRTLLRGLLEDEKYTTVVCLQEVSPAWSDWIHGVCEETKCHMITSMYPMATHGCLAVAVLFPTCALYCRTSLQLVPGLVVRGRMRHSNVALYVELATLPGLHKDDGLPFIVSIATYHMPCAYYDPMLMATHAGRVAGWATHLHEANRTDLLVVAGDFNSLPNSCVVASFSSRPCGNASCASTSGCIPSAPKTNHSPCAVWSAEFNKQRANAFRGPGPPHGFSWRSAKKPEEVPFVEAHRAVHNADPEWTNWAHRANVAFAFQGTIDYIFYRPSPKVRCVAAGTVSRNVTAPIPSAQAPSDHIPVFAVFERT